MKTTQLLGIIVRSSSTRNAFEFYNPFLGVCRKVLDGDCKLILSSEWQYIPFTYPQNLQELPNFVVIGLPASESDNTLIFPVAGHELGHSIWSREKFRDRLGPRIRNKIVAAYRVNKVQFEKLFPDAANANLETDLFPQNLISESVRYSLLQSEEFFSDFIGLLIFGESYLKAYEYLIAPTLGGKRAYHYPENRNRALTLATYAQKIGVDMKDFEQGFSIDQQGQNPYENFIVAMADAGTTELVEELFAIAKSHLESHGLLPPKKTEIQAVLKYFERGVPYTRQVDLGVLISAAWSYYDEPNIDVSSKLGRPLQELVNDLVLKSAEIGEYSEYMK